MKYVIRLAVLGKVPEIDITAKHYAELENAKKTLSHALAIEQKYDILIDSYLSFEHQVLRITANHMIRDLVNYMDFYEISHTMNVALVNLLTATRMYSDQLTQHVRECVPNKSEARKAVKSWFNREYDENIEYRFMEALRNHVQHKGIPVHTTSPGGGWTSLDENGYLEHYLELASLRSILEEDSGFKKKVLNELNERIDLKIAVRKYVESLSNIQESARNMIEQYVSDSRKLIKTAHDTYLAVQSGSSLGISACKILNGKQQSAIPLLLDWDDVRLALKRRNAKLVNLSKRYATGRKSV